MTQADSVLSTPPTNTSVPHSSRRDFLAQAAAVAAADGALGISLRLPVLAEASERAPDAAFDLNEAHRWTHAAHEKALRAGADAPGLFACLAYLPELDSAFETEWMITDRAFAPALISSFAASLKNIGVQA
jgi:hypothetical protein